MAKKAKKAKKTNGTCGRSFSGSSASVDLQRSLENRLQAAVDVNGSMENLLERQRSNVQRIGGVVKQRQIEHLVKIAVVD